MNAHNIDIALVGAGMGSESCLTKEVKNLIDNADIVFGAARLSNSFGDSDRQNVIDTYRVNDMIEKLEEADKDIKAVFIYSGDSGFYSGAEAAYLRVKEWAEEKKKENADLNVNIEIKAGISSVSYLASRIGISWQDAKLYSLHGREYKGRVPEVIESARYNEKTFVLLSGASDVIRLTDEILNIKNVILYLGYHLSYDDEEVMIITPDKKEEFLKGEIKEGLYTAFIQNVSPETKYFSYGIPTEEYIREENVPITKEEVREIVLSKLRLFRGCTFYDIGGGTGGVTVDVAKISPDIKVISIEKRPERTELIRKNIDKFGLRNVTPLTGNAAETLALFDENNLVKNDNEYENYVREIIKNNPPDRVFIGGTEGQFRDIIRELKKFGRKIRVCMTAVTLETRNEIFKLADEDTVDDLSVVEVNISKLVRLGKQHMMKAENGILVATFQL